MTPRQMIEKNITDAELVFLPDEFEHALIGVTSNLETAYSAIAIQTTLNTMYASCERCQIEAFEQLVDDYIGDCVFVYIPYVS